MKSAGFIRSGNELERDVLFERPSSKYVETAVIEPSERQPTQGGAAARSVVCDLVRTFAVPKRCHAERDRPIGGILPDWRITIVHQLVAVVFELLSKVVQHWPGFMASRTP